MLFVANLDIYVVWSQFLGTVEWSERMSNQVESIVEKGPHKGIHIKPYSKVWKLEIHITNKATPKLTPLLITGRLDWRRRLLIYLYMFEYLSNHVPANLA